MSLPTAAGLADHVATAILRIKEGLALRIKECLVDNVATAKLRIEEVCARHDAQLKTSMTDFRSFPDDLNHRQSLIPMSFELIDDNDHNNEDEAIPVN